MNCIIIDDEPLALSVIKSYCEDIGTINVIATFTNAIDAIDVLNKQSIDLVFSDIEMPQINGIDFIKALENKPLFIFTTAYPEYALEGFELNAVDYLVKPIPFPRFIKAVNRAKELYQLKQTENLEVPQNIRTETNNLKDENQFVFVKSEYDNISIKLDEITYIQGLKDYLKIYTKGNKPILTLMSFKDIEIKLANSNFVRVHRSYIVNIRQIESIQRSKIIIDNVRVPIGESYRLSFFNIIGL